MIGLKINQVKSLFFDRGKVLEAVDRATAKNLSKMGAFVRRTAKGLIRKVGKKGEPSKPGKPPKSRLGYLKEFLFFAYEPQRQAAVVGPALLNGRSGIAPSVLEFGGIERAQKARTIRVAGKNASRSIARGKVLTYKPRPYMAPALAKEAPKFPAIWADTVKGTA